MYKQPTFPSYFSFRTSFFIGLFGLFLVSSTALFAQEENSRTYQHETKEMVHKRGEQSERSIQNRRGMQNHQGNRKDDSSLPRLEKFMELETEIMAERLNLSDEQIELLHSQQDALVEKYSKARLEIEKEAQVKREEMNLRRDSMRKIHQENPEARPSREVREAMQKAMKSERENLEKDVRETNRVMMNEFQKNRMLMLFDVLSNEQYRGYLEQREAMRKEIQS
ncbi:MAG: hypothetical protein ISR37_03235, partial [Balneolaceae bacterium]|nr:hypothetical protein [Balneolaceae bacterium]